LQSQLILQQEVEEDSDSMVVMKDDAVLLLGTYSPRSDNETKVKTRAVLGHVFGICNMVHMED
jgi:hypothetical protein